jgi:hypothetical protein
MWAGKEKHKIEAMRAKKMQEHAAAAESGPFGESGSGGANIAVRGAITTFSPQFADRFTKSNNRKLEKMREKRPYSALEMILTLEEQVSKDPHASSFEMPGNNDAAPLEEYLIRIMLQHQKDMADINPSYTELRKALVHDVAAVAKPLARAIREGDLAPLELVRFIGEGKIIKNHGRKIADPKEVMALVKREAPKQSAYLHVDPKEYYQDASFSREELKTVLGHLNGEEKRVFASMIPDAVLEDAGMKPKEIKELRVATSKNYEHRLGELLLGLHAESPDSLKKTGMAEEEVGRIEQASQAMAEYGEQAIHALKASPTNDRGIEHDVVNGLVSRIVGGDKAYLGRVMDRGRVQMKQLPTAPEKEAREVLPDDPALAHAEREMARQAQRGAAALE